MKKMMNDTVTIRYNNRNIELNYSNIGEYEPILKYNLSIVKASGEGDYDKAEQEAQLYLIKNALNKSTHFHKLEKIVGITQNIIYSEKGEVKIILEGFGVFQ